MKTNAKRLAVVIALGLASQAFAADRTHANEEDEVQESFFTQWKLHTVRAMHPYIEGIYRLYGAESHFRNVHLADDGHDFGISKRKAVYDFLAQHLGLDHIPFGNGRPAKYPEDVDVEPSDSLRVWGLADRTPFEHGGAAAGHARSGLGLLNAVASPCIVV